MDEKEFQQWIQRIQTLQEETVSASTSQTDTDDDITQDLIAAFRWENKKNKKLLISNHWIYFQNIEIYIYLYSVFDRDGNGYITRDELQIAMEMMQENVTEIQVNEMLQLADLDKDGKINYEGDWNISSYFLFLI